MKKILMIIGLLMFLNISTPVFCSEENDKVESSKYSISESVVSETSSDITSNDSNKVSKQNKKGNGIIWCALIVSLIANLSFTTILIVKVEEKSRSRTNNLRNKLDKVENDIMLRMSQIKTGTTQHTLSESEINLIVDRVLECKRLDADERVQESVREPIPNSENIQGTRLLYASAANKDNMFFMNVTEQPSADTIYVLMLMGDNTANFVIYDGAKDVVISCEDYLRNVCNIIGRGNNIEGCEPGCAEKTNEGYWKVVKKSNVKFV